MLKRLGALAAVGLALALPARAMSLVPMDLDQIIEVSTTAFEGTCVDVRTEHDPMTKMIVTYTTFQVRDAIKGKPGFRHVIKQIGGKLPGGADAVNYKVPGVPKFAIGEDYVVFLAGVSAVGFSSPIGMSQGTFVVRRGLDGVTKVSNGRDLREMMDKTDARVPTAVREKLAAGAVRELELGEFKQLVHGLSGRPR